MDDSDGPYRTAEHRPRHSTIGLVLIKELLDRDIHKMRVVADRVHSVSNCLGIITYGAVNILVQSYQESFLAGMEYHRNRLNDMLAASDIAGEDFSDIPVEYEEALLLDYAISQYELWKTSKQYGLDMDPNFSACYRTPASMIRRETRRREAIRTSISLEGMTLGYFVEHVIAARDYDTLTRIKSASPYIRSESFITNLAVMHHDDLLKEGTEKDLCAAAQSFADFHYWDGLRNMVEFLIEKQATKTPEEVALGITPVSTKDRTVPFYSIESGNSNAALSIAFFCLVDHELTGRARNLMQHMRQTDVGYLKDEIMWAEHKVKKEQKALEEQRRPFLLAA